MKQGDVIGGYHRCRCRKGGAIAIACVLLAYWYYVVLSRENRRRYRVAVSDNGRVERSNEGVRSERVAVVEPVTEFGSQTG